MSAIDPTAGSILDLTIASLSKFDEALASQIPFYKERLENRLADFRLWVDGVGAIAESGLSLDSRLRSRPSDMAIVKSILLMLSDSLDYYVSLSQAGKSSDDGIQNIDSAIQNLALIGVAIRRAGKASRSRRADRAFDPGEHPELRKHLECLLLLRPTAEGRHSDELDPSKLSALQRRLIDANLRRRHQFLLAQRRSRNRGKAHRHRPALETPLPVGDTFEKEEDKLPVHLRNPEGSRDYPPTSSTKGRVPILAPFTSGFSRASTAEGTLKYAPSERYTPGETKTQITLIASDAEFPEPPVIPEDRKTFQCPCCCQSLQAETLKDPKLWKQHVVEDLYPYTCIAEDCPTPQLLFRTRSEWEVHVKKSHLPRWQCPFCDEDDVKQPSMEATKTHLQSDHRDELSDNSLSTLLSWSAIWVMGIKACPFCSDNAPEDAPDLVDHVLREAYEFALRALPWPKPFNRDLNKHPGIFKLSGKIDDESPIGRWIKEPGPEDENALNLKLCHYDRADHSEPVNLDEYTDYFDNCEYFAEAESDDTANRKTLASASTQTTAGNRTADMVEELADGSLLQRIANKVESLEMQLETSSRELGKEHFSTLIIMASLASAYGDQGRWEEAESLEVQVMETNKKSLGNEHPDTLTNMANLASWYGDQGRWKEAESMNQRVLEGREKALGRDRVSTLDTVNNLGNLYSVQGRLAEAEALYGRAPQGKEKALGPDHTSVLETVHNLAGHNNTQGRLAESEALYERTLQDREPTLGSDHSGAGGASTQPQVPAGQSTLPRVAVELINKPKKDNWRVRHAAVEALAAQSALPESAVNAIAKRLEDEDPSVRNAAIWAFEMQPALPKATVHAIVKRLEDKDPSVRNAAIRALETQSASPKAAADAILAKGKAPVVVDVGPRPVPPPHSEQDATSQVVVQRCRGFRG